MSENFTYIHPTIRSDIVNELRDIKKKEIGTTIAEPLKILKYGGHGNAAAT